MQFSETERFWTVLQLLGWVADLIMLAGVFPLDLIKLRTGVFLTASQSLSIH